MWKNNKKKINPLTISKIYKIGWVRKENAMTQTSPQNIHSVVSFFKNYPIEDPDLLEVLSLCEENNDVYDSFEKNIIHQQPKPNYNSIESTYCLLCNSVNCDDDNVVLRRYNSSDYINSNTPKRHAKSVPINCSEIHGSDCIQRLNDNQLKDRLSRKDAFESFNRKHHLDNTKRPFGLQINQEFFNNISELPSPSSASLHSGYGPIAIRELTTKSNSAPVLLKKEKRHDDFAAQTLVRIFFFILIL